MDILSVLILTSISCSFLGVFLILRKLSMLTDAISHTVLLGIVLTYFVVQDLSSPFLVLGATIMGFITVYLIESLGNSKLVKYNDAIGVVFPLLFSIAVIIISRYFRNVHLDMDVVLLGEVLFASLDTVKIFGITISKTLLQSLITTIIVVGFIILNFRNLKISTFNEEYAKLIGVKVTLLFYMLMSLSSLTAVVSFNSVGAILVISFFIGPSATALLFSKSLKQTLLFTAIFSVINCTIAYMISMRLNVSVSGMAATINTLMFTIMLVINKNKGKICLSTIKGKNT